VGYRDVRANESRVHTRITDSGSGREQQCRTITIWRTELGLWWGLRLGFDPWCWYGDGCPGHWVGVVSPKCPSGDHAQVCGQCSVWGHQVILAVCGNRLDDFKECWRNRQHVFGVLLGLGMRWTGSRGHCTGFLSIGCLMVFKSNKLNHFSDTNIILIETA